MLLLIHTCTFEITQNNGVAPKDTSEYEYFLFETNFEGSILEGQNVSISCFCYFLLLFIVTGR